MSGLYSSVSLPQLWKWKFTGQQFCFTSRAAHLRHGPSGKHIMLTYSPKPEDHRQIYLHIWYKCISQSANCVRVAFNCLQFSSLLSLSLMISFAIHSYVIWAEKQITIVTGPIAPNFLNNPCRKLGNAPVISCLPPTPIFSSLLPAF